jgi:hypothetical protein
MKKKIIKLIFYAVTFSFTGEIIYPCIPLIVDFLGKNFKFFTNLLEVRNGRSYLKLAQK